MAFIIDLRLRPAQIDQDASVETKEKSRELQGRVGQFSESQTKEEEENILFCGRLLKFLNVCG